MTSIAVRFPDEIFAVLRRSPAELEREVRLAAVIDWYRRGLISQSRAAEIADIARADFIDALAQRKIDVFTVDLDSLAQEMALE